MSATKKRKADAVADDESKTNGNKKEVRRNRSSHDTHVRSEARALSCMHPDTLKCHPRAPFPISNAHKLINFCNCRKIVQKALKTCLFAAACSCALLKLQRQLKFWSNAQPYRWTLHHAAPWLAKSCMHAKHAAVPTRSTIAVNASLTCRFLMKANKLPNSFACYVQMHEAFGQFVHAYGS